jgi:2-amino-4-hydroxy-6-hydroxymethyldihydropteridine diphosphokinase
MRDIAYIALGSNLGDRAEYLALARRRLAALPGSRLLDASSIEETEAVGNVPQGPYLNQMVALETTLSSHALLDALHAIEHEAGRERTVPWGPRTLDLDIVMFEAQTISDPDLTVPHLELPHRDFWQRGIAELKGKERG